MKENKDKNDSKNKSFCRKKVSILRLIYVSIIFAIVQVFLLVICPGKISSYAFENFSFASTLISIVLAVVSIVYTLQSGLSSFGQLNSIKTLRNVFMKK